MLASIVVIAAFVIVVVAIVLGASTFFQTLIYFNVLYLCKIVCYLHLTDRKTEFREFK